MNVDNVDISSSDDEILTDIFESHQNDDPARSQFSKGDIVWAEFRNIHWPALVRNVSKKYKKVTLWYLDSPSKCFKVPLTKVRNFKDKEVSEKSVKAVAATPEKQKHEDVLYRTLTYLQRKADGIIDDPAKYFDIKSYYLALSNSPNKVDSNKAFGKNEVDSFKTFELRKFDNEELSASDFSDEESILYEDIEQQVEQRLLGEHTDFEVIFSDSDEDEALVNNIISCIKSGFTDSYLLQIRQRKIQSNYQHMYDDAVKNNNGKVLQIIDYNPVKRLEKLKEIASYLMDLFEKLVSGGKTEIVDYVTSVWLPESIIKAVSQLKEGSFQGKKSARKSTRRKLFDASTTGEVKCRKKSVTKGNISKNKNTCKAKFSSKKRKDICQSIDFDQQECVQNSEQSVIKEESFQGKKSSKKNTHRKLVNTSSNDEVKCRKAIVTKGSMSKKKKTCKAKRKEICQFNDSDQQESLKNTEQSAIKGEKNFTKGSCEAISKDISAIGDVCNNVSIPETPERILRSSVKHL